MSKHKIKRLVQKAVIASGRFLADFVDKNPYLSIFFSVAFFLTSITALSVDRPLALVLAILVFVPAIPVLATIAWLEKCYWIRKMSQKWWAKALWALVIVILVVLANSWAQGVVVSAFNAPAGALPITQGLLTWFYVPAVILQRVFSLGIEVVVDGAFIGLLYAILFSRTFLSGLFTWVKILLALFFFGYYLETTMKYGDDSHNLTLRLGIQLDFHAHNPCKKLDAPTGSKFLLLDTGTVLVYAPPDAAKKTLESLKPQKCDLADDI